ncbi:signal transduction histidine kinase [Murinocardiopsis flavida]|uniref:histidine kinase n=1 Tax=Murinocardiopsis flavida TaxID=645275 RepID=A0A2P8D974_9ACTN|nr:sensor histidine kinase [Murinocardiopsis flavida]PSK93765.1 signal transduction histidine kinase [Murinocardiopsis flavida]
MPQIHYYRASRTRLLAFSLLFTVLSVTGTVLLALTLLAGFLSAIWLGLPLLVLVATLIRRYTGAVRRILGEFLPDGPIPSPYRPTNNTTLRRRISSTLTDPAYWRDLAWLALNATVGLVIAAVPAALFAAALDSVAGLYYHQFLTDPWIVAVHITSPLAAILLLPQAAVLFFLFWLLAPPCLTAYARLSRLLLAPTETMRLSARVTHLATSRAETIDAQASEVRRIERDLHDGAQARLVSLGMSLGMAEDMLERDPQTAQRLLTEARESTRVALTELRDLVRGIHPPVLVERGLDGAVRAFAVAQPMPITVDIDLPGRPADPVESAAYFAIAEILANTLKHANADRAWVRINHGRGRMVMVVGDNGTGGATAAPGTGLDGIRRRLSAFDGTMSLVSPKGGPTIVTMELPCVLSSPKTSPSSATD